MNHGALLTENQLDEWVRGNSRTAQGLIVELIWRLAVTSSPSATERRFPLGDSVGQAGPDGVLDTEFEFEPFIPKGISFWEIGTGVKAGDKATADYRDLTQAIPEEVRKRSTFAFITPLSGRRDWPHTWKEDAQATWLKERADRKEWMGVRVIDGTKLIDWLSHFPAVERWLACSMNIRADQVETVEESWSVLNTFGAPPPLPPEVFLANRESARGKLAEAFTGNILQLRLETRFPDQVAQFVVAHIMSLAEESRVGIAGRCLVVSGMDGLNSYISLRENHVFVADFDLDTADSSGTKLLEKARRAGHVVIYGGMPGGIPHPNQAPIPNPRAHQIEEVLKKAGYSDERARTLASKSGGNLNYLLRLLQNLSQMPEWAQGTAAAELAIAEFLGAWNEQTEGDRAAAEQLSGKAYGEWIGPIREVASRPGAPLIQRDGTWKVVARYEAWYGLGPRLYNEHLDRLKNVALLVLKERDPKFELPPEDRFASLMYGKTRRYTPALCNGLAETLALLGSHPKALTSCSRGKADAIAALTVRELLTDADWVLWASLDHQLPSLAEAAPTEFLKAVDGALYKDDCPFDEIFRQERSGITGTNNLTGLLWALETLAWSPDNLARVTLILGGMAAKDPGGNWGNRPSNSLSTIYFPWFTQTCAPVEVRKAAIDSLTKRFPAVAWKLLLTLLPRSHSMSMGSHKPKWREFIPEDWSPDVSRHDYFGLINVYAELALALSKQDRNRLVVLIDELDHLPPPARGQLLDHLRSEATLSMPQEQRTVLWTRLVDLVSKHRRFKDAQWAMEADAVDEIAAVAEKLSPESPSYIYRRLFTESESELFEETGDYQEQRQKHDSRRQNAVREIYEAGGFDAILEFARSVETPWRVGYFFALPSEGTADDRVLPDLIGAEEKHAAQFAGGFVWGRFRTHAWAWVDSLDTTHWTPEKKGQFLAYLPFTSQTWLRSSSLLGEDESPYWTKTSANPYEAEDGWEIAARRLIGVDRAFEALGSLDCLRNKGLAVDPTLAVQVLRAVLREKRDFHVLNVMSIINIITYLQNNTKISKEDILAIEWGFLPLLDRHREGYPKRLEQELASTPEFFFDVLKLVFRSKNDDAPPAELDENRKHIAGNAFRLLHEWRTPPGTQDDGSFDGEALGRWVDRVKAMTTETDFLGIAYSRLGHVLRYSPANPDGLWIHSSVAAVLDADDAGDARAGFTAELFNSRGVYGFTAGDEERQIAARYRTQAQEVDSRGFHRLASSLRDLADSYDRDAERQAAVDLYDE